MAESVFPSGLVVVPDEHLDMNRALGLLDELEHPLAGFLRGDLWLLGLSITN